MSFVHLQDQKYYEDMYDRHTIEDGRRGMTYYDDFYDKFKKKLPKNEKLDRPGNAIVLNVFYMQTVGNGLLQRYENRDQAISKMMDNDRAKDDQIASARLTEEPYCHHCSKQGLRIIDKSLLHRGKHYNPDEPEEVLFMLKCPHCQKNSAFWEDGTAWKPKPTLCPKCNSEMNHKTTRTKAAFIFTYTCTSCGHLYKDRMDRTAKEERPDPNYDKDKVYFCLLDKELRDKLFSIRKDFEGMAQLGNELKEKEDNKEVYTAIDELKKPKIAELSNILTPLLDKAGFIEFSLDKPEIGKDVIVGFNCLDSKNERSDYDSEKTLKKTINKALSDTNWRLMSDGIHYRLGYLSGRLRAYEQEEDLKSLVIKKVSSKNEIVSSGSRSKDSQLFKNRSGKEIIP